jgi:hypothetical protein
VQGLDSRRGGKAKVIQYSRGEIRTSNGKGQQAKVRGRPFKVLAEKYGFANSGRVVERRGLALTEAVVANY